MHESLGSIFIAAIILMLQLKPIMCTISPQSLVLWCHQVMVNSLLFGNDMLLFQEGDGDTLVNGFLNLATDIVYVDIDQDSSPNYMLRRKSICQPCYIINPHFMSA
ncbi:hypothetical protein VNO78_33632 [Psophocarpus tetragonolobus]|uniref:Uncharacterized protein n=1 Tax=Psophocarpus tetragonolobus TaxID=3891 RepID=A0AAN9RSA5_PSOTE